MNGTKVTEDDVALWRKLREKDDLSFNQIAEHKDVQHSVWTIARHLKSDGRRKGVPGRKPKYPELWEQAGGDKNLYRKLRDQHPERLAEHRKSSKDWKERNRARARAYDDRRSRQEIAEREWKAKGCPPPSLGRTCTCPVPLLDDFALCDWCGCYRQTPQAVLTSLTATQVHSEALHRPSGLRGVGERLQAPDLEAEVG